MKGGYNSFGEKESDNISGRESDMKWYCCKIFLALWFMAVATPYGCSRKERNESTEPPSEERIAQTNKVRKELGIREIKDDWIFEERESGAERWKDNGGYRLKSVKYDDEYEEILWEIDYYYSGRSFQNPAVADGTSKESLAFHYNYRKRDFMVFVVSDDEKILSLVEGWYDFISKAEWGNARQRNEETIRVAEKILKMWGLQRL